MEENLQNGEGVSLKQIWLSIKTNALIIAICLLLGIAGGVAYYFNAKTEYTSTQALSITCKDDDGVSRMSTAYLNTIVESCRQNVVLAEANRIYSPNGASAREIRQANMNVTYDDERVSYHIYISYTDSTQELAEGKLAALTEAAGTVGAALAADVITYNVTLTPATDEPDTVRDSNKNLGLALFVLAGVAIAFFIVLFRYLADDTVKTKEQLEKLVGAKMFAVLQPSGGENAEEGLKRLCDNALFLIEKEGVKVLQAASAFSREEASAAAADLAVRLGACGKRVLALDLNFTAPSLHKKLGAENIVGLSEYVAGSVKAEDAIVPVPHENVWLLPQGACGENPAALLISDRFRALIDELKGRYDAVLLDTSPVLESAEHLLVSGVADAAVFFTAYGKTKRAHIADAVSELNRGGAKIAGAAFTEYDPKIGRSAGYKGASFYAGYARGN